MGINKRLIDVPLKDQLEFDYERAIRWSPLDGDGKNPPPVCIRCMCKIFQHFWTPAMEYKRRTGTNFCEETTVELPRIHD